MTTRSAQQSTSYLKRQHYYCKDVPVSSDACSDTTSPDKAKARRHALVFMAGWTCDGTLLCDGSGWSVLTGWQMLEIMPERAASSVLSSRAHQRCRNRGNVHVSPYDDP